MRRSLRIWLSFALALAVMFGVMAWVSATVLRLERAQWLSQLRAAREEDTRLALWRMEAALTPLIVQESARPYFAYRAFYPVGRSYGRMFDRMRAGEALAPSDLLLRAPPNTLLHFQIDESGAITSPQVPEDDLRSRAVGRYTTAERIAAAAQQLSELHDATRLDGVLAALGPEADSPLPSIEVAAGPFNMPQGQSRGQRDNDEQQSMLNQSESQARVMNTVRAQKQSGAQESPAPNVREGAIRPVWLGHRLMLLRRVRVDTRAYVQGCWLDWPALRQSLLASTGDLFPHAKLKPAPVPAGAVGDKPAGGESGAYRLAALPVTFEPGPPPKEPAQPESALGLSLRTAWACLLLATAAVAVLLLGALSLGKRRADFVSAVTHELRTPLTTFRMYAEMLAADMVRDPAQRQEYLHTLLVESNRLRHLVENVLTYARLEARSTRRHAQALGVGQLLAGVTARLKDRAAADGMALTIEPADQADRLCVRADSWAVEMILFNLVDNACKYASGASDRRIHLSAERRKGAVALAVRDHGPGVPPQQAGKLFRAFGRSAPSPSRGVGLGLAISRRLARNMNGDLAVEPPEDQGARFVLTLPLEPTSE